MHDSLTAAWKVLEYLPRRHWNNRLVPARNEWILYRKRPRSIPEGSVLHQSVLDRKNDPAANYTPANLPKTYSVEPWSVWPLPELQDTGGPAAYRQSA